MPYQADVYRVMIASPSDVAAERQQIRELIAEWTAVHSADKGAVLLPVAWESHSSPEMGDRPQAIINRRLLKECDFLIAAFWTRIGTPTGEAVSGTVEEIEEHIASDKPAMLYFSKVPVELDSVDHEQYEELKKFRSSCQSRGLYETYESIGEFREKLSRQLAVTMIRLCAERRVDTDGAVQAPDFMLTEPPASPPSPSVTPIARRILKNMGLDSRGVLMRVRVMGGTIIQANGKQLNVPGDPRNTAEHEAAIEELDHVGLIQQSDTKGEVFRLTHIGYAEADRIPASEA